MASVERRDMTGMRETETGTQMIALTYLYAEIQAERERAHRKHGDTSMESAPAHDPTGRRYRILAEEVGEIAKEFNDAEAEQRAVSLAALRKELIQTAAMAAAWADAIGSMPPVEVPRRCGHDGGRSIGAGHVCGCNGRAGHPLDNGRPHGCECGAMWADDGGH